MLMKNKIQITLTTFVALAIILIACLSVFKQKDHQMQLYVVSGSAETTSVVFEGVITRRLPTIDVGPREAIRFQTVQYNVLSVSEGVLEEKIVTVSHPLVEPYLDVNGTELSKSTFRIGNHVRIHARKSSRGGLSCDRESSNVKVLKQEA